MNDADKKLLAMSRGRSARYPEVAMSAVPRLIAEKEALLRLLRRCCERFSPHELLREHIENALAADDAAAKEPDHD